MPDTAFSAVQLYSCTIRRTRSTIGLFNDSHVSTVRSSYK